MAVLAQVERLLIFSVLAGVAVALGGMVLYQGTEVAAVMTLTFVLRSLVGVASLVLYLFMLRLVHLPGAWAYAALAALLTLFAPLLTWLLIGYHILQVNRLVLAPRGYRIGLLGPKVW
ncbi:hypothetical protein [Deinococcus hohokamensis]|uniref:Uncharacterized protein n=1 Tax=Deinococcus hohokamensis TaxID=309883 RepID=A0ABV9IC34_9DEIO